MLASSTLLLFSVYVVYMCEFVCMFQLVKIDF